MSPAPAARPAGTVLEDRYRIDGVVARGGMSTVHRGVDLRLDRPVAIKVMDPALADDPAFVRRFEREARAAARLSHPGIVGVHDQGHDPDGTIFLVMELVEGGTLRDVLREHGRLAPAMAVTVVEQVVAALQVAHARGLVHRDVKPENVLVSDEGAVKVADFGLVAAAWGDPDGGDAADTGGSSSDGLILGTVSYLAPEQVTSGRADERSDLYAAGVVLFELLTGTPPHAGATPMETAYRHVDADVPPPSSRVPGLAPALDRLVLDATRRSPDRRPPDAAAFLAAVRAVRAATRLPFTPVPPPAIRSSVPPPPRPVHGTRLIDRREEPDDGDDGAYDEDGYDDGYDDDRPASRRWGRLRRRGRDEQWEAVAADRRRREVPDPDDAWDDEDPDDGYGDDPADDWDGGWDDGWDGDDAAPGPGRDVDDQIERLERRRVRTRSRRLFAVGVTAVSAATVAAGLVGWELGLPG